MYDTVAASLSGVAHLCLACVAMALWWADRDARFGLAWAGGFAALGTAAAVAALSGAAGGGVSPVIAFTANGVAVALLLGGTRLYLGRATTMAQLLTGLVLASSLPALGFLHGPEAAARIAGALQALLFAWMGLAFIRRSNAERVAGALLLARALLTAGHPPLAAVAPLLAAIAMHFTALASGLALLGAALARSWTAAAAREGRERAMRLEALYTDAPGLLTVMDGGGRIVAASNDWLQFMGYSREEIIGQNRLSLASAAVQARADEFTARLRRDRRVDDFEHEAPRKDGSIALLRTAMRAHRNPITGRFEIIAVSIDRTAQRRAEQAAERARNLLERILEAAPAAISVKDSDLRFVLWNANAAELFGLRRDEVIGRRLVDVRPSAVSEALEAEDRMVLQGETPPPREGQVEGTGEARWVLMSKTPLLSESGTIEGVISASLDITGLKRIQAVLRESEESLIQAQRLGRTGYIRSNFATGRIVWSDSMFELRGVPRRESFEMSETMAFVHPDDRERYMRERNRGIAEKRRFEVDIRLLQPDGEIRWEHSVGYPQLGEDGDVTGMLLFVQDITERKLAEEALRASEAKFAGAFHGSTDMMSLMRPDDGTFVEVNEAWLACSGLQRDEVIGRDAATLGTWADADARAEAYRRLATEGVVRNFDAQMRRKDGAIRDIRMSGSRIGEGGDAYHFWVGRDVTEEREAVRRIAALNTANEVALRQIRSITDNLPVLIIHADRQRRFLFVNRTAEQWFARPASELVGRNLADVVGDEFTQGSGDVVADVLAGHSRTIDRRIVYPDGKERDVEVVYVPDIGADGTIGAYYSLVTDITERKRVDEALRTSEARFAGAFHGSTDMMALMQPDDGTYIEVNDAWLSAIGLRREEVVGRTAGELGFWADEAERLKIVRLRAAGAPIRNLEMKMRRRDGEMRDVRISGSHIAAGAAEYYFWVGRDVTEEREAVRRIAALNAANEAALRQIRSITDHLPVMICYTDRDRRCRFINRTGEQWFDKPASALLGTRLLEAMGPDSVDLSTGPIAEVLAGRLSTVGRKVQYPDGKARDVEITYVPDIVDDGSVNGYYTLVTDVTDRRATEDQLRHAQRLEAIGKLTGGVAHDFNNLLGVISGNLELADEMIGSDGELRRMIRTAIRATERGATLTRSLLAYARQQPLLPRAIDVNSLVREMADLLRRTVPENIEIHVISADGLWRCEADPGQLQNALLNLVVNARDAMPQGGRLTIESSNAQLDDEYAAADAEVEPGQYIVIAVSDTGTGMPPDVVARAFDPFFTTKDVGRGTGLGLSMVYGFARQSSGQVKIYSEVGHGTTVRLYLPRSKESAEVSAPPSKVSDAQGETILLVEDNPDVRTLTFALLRSFGYAVQDAGDAEAALRILEQHPEVALLLTDVVLPGEMNGERLAARAREMRPDLRVLYMSGYPENAILHQGRLDPGVHLLQKPFRMRDLAAKVRAALDEGKAA